MKATIYSTLTSNDFFMPCDVGRQTLLSEPKSLPTHDPCLVECIVVR